MYGNFEGLPYKQCIACVGNIMTPLFPILFMFDQTFAPTSLGGSRRWGQMIFDVHPDPESNVFPKNMGVSKNRGTPKWMVYNGKPY